MSQQRAPPTRPIPATPGNAEEYVSVPRVPYSPPRSRNAQPASLLRNGRTAPRVHHHTQSSSISMPPKPSPPSKNQTAQDVQMHALGGGFGPYAHREVNPLASPSPRGSFRRGHDRTRGSVTSLSDRTLRTQNPYTSAAPATVVAPRPPVWDPKDELDPLHDPDPIKDAQDDQYCDPLSGRGWLNMSAIIFLCCALIILFAGYPIISWAGRYQRLPGAYNLGTTNASGQIPLLAGLPNLIDKDTPSGVYSRTGWDGKKYSLVFSDEFNRDGRTFWPGDDAWWEAVDLHYWPTGDLEWYTPEAITTSGGSLVITMTEIENHQLNFQSGMLQSWNKFCFSSGYVEVNVSLPGTHQTAGYWPAAWTMGNLGRAGYGASTDGMWPYSYDTCDPGTFIGQQDKNGQPSTAETLGDPNAVFSSLPGQKLSACTCPGSDHPGPKTSAGRGVPEIDIFEAQIETVGWKGEVSQSFQVAPFNAFYQFDNTSTQPLQPNSQHYNPYKGGPYQQAVSVVTEIPDTGYTGVGGWGTYGFEYWGNKKDRGNTYITWYVNGQPTWTAKADAVGADATSNIGPRLISEEPMYLIFNLGMAYGFQHQDWEHLRFPAQMLIDYVRVYQRQGSQNVGCDPDDHPTSDYINSHLNAYMNPNATTWQNAGYEFPRNSKYDNCAG